MSIDSAQGTAMRVRGGEITAESAISAALDRLDSAARLNAVDQLYRERALDRARALDAQIAAGEGLDRPMLGVPIAIKSNIALESSEEFPTRTTASSRILADYRSPFSATAVERLEAAGAVVIASVAMDEFGMGSSGERACTGATHNPWAHGFTPGGSSSGSAAVVACGAVPIALGSDTGGSVRQPGAFTGTVGFKPSYGAVSRHGLVAYGSSLDQIGPIARSVADAALAMSVLAGADAHDPTTIELPGVVAGGAGGAGARIGVCRALNEGNHPAVDRALALAEGELRAMGHEVVEVELPSLPTAVNAYYIVAPAEACSNLARFDGVRYGASLPDRPGDTPHDRMCRARSEFLGPEVRRRIILGRFVLSAGYADRYYQRATQARVTIAQEFERAFAGCTAILMPTTPGPAFRLGDRGTDPMAMLREDMFTVAANLAGLPAISVPAGMSDAEPEAEGDPGGLPVAVQLCARRGGDWGLLELAGSLEGALGYAGQYAPPQEAKA